MLISCEEQGLENHLGQRQCSSHCLGPEKLIRTVTDFSSLSYHGENHRVLRKLLMINGQLLLVAPFDDLGGGSFEVRKYVLRLDF